MSSPSRRRVGVRRSPIHGRGLYATTDLHAGERLLEYRGEVISWDEAHLRYEGRADVHAGATYFFDLGDDAVIDGTVGGNSSRFLNHGCAPNCEAVNSSGRVHIYAVRDVAAGEELLLDYGLIVDDPDDPDTRALYVCRCAAPDCRTTMLADAG